MNNTHVQNPALKGHGEYILEVKKLLPPDALKPDPRKILYLFAYLSLLVISYLLFRLTDKIVFYALICFVTTHCLSCIGFLAHELSHHSITNKRKLRYFLEVIFWGINLIPATLWDRVHNHTHHTQTNTPKDPDRLYFVSEKRNATKLYSRIFYPSKKNRWNPLVAFHFIPYIFRNIVSAFYTKNRKPSIVPPKPKYSLRQKIRILLELLVIGIFQWGIFFLVGQEMIAYLFAGPVSYLLTSAIFNVYIFTNHFLNAVDDHSDPLLGTTSVGVPALINKLHFNFAYHTEHHLFPSMNSNFFPELSRILQEKYPDRYHFLKLGEAWQKLWKNEEFISEPMTSLNDTGNNRSPKDH